MKQLWFKKIGIHAPANPLVRVLGILLMAVITPVLLFSVYEITSTGEAERYAREAYIRQLDAILFSANQFASDAIQSWKREVENEFVSHGTYTGNRSSKFTGSGVIEGVVLMDSTLRKFDWVVKKPEMDSLFTQLPGGMNRRQKTRLETPVTIQGKVEQEILSARYGIYRLIRFSRENYFKTEPVTIGDGQYFGYLFVVESPKTNPVVACMVLKRSQLLDKILMPRFRSIGGDRFAIGVLDSLSGREIAGTKPPFDSAYTKSAGLWIVPEWKVAIRLNGMSIESVYEQRRVSLIALIILLNLMIATAVYLVYRNIRKEMKLALIKSEFVGNVSHELRTPLSLIGMFAETLESGRVRSEEKKQEYYSIISQETKRLSRIVNKILNFSQIEAGVRKYHFEEQSLNEVVESVFNSYTFHFQQKDFNASLQLMAEDVILPLDKEAVVESVINLLDNAMKYSRDEKEIAVKTYLKGDMVCISIKDSGIGISAEDQARVFEKFFRASEGGTHNVKGTGLGLSIVQHIAEAHGGYVQLQSKPGEGSTFTIHLAVHGADSAE